MRRIGWAWFLVACEGPATAPEVQPAPVPPPQVSAPVTPPPALPTERVGKVVEVLDSADYAIARLDACGQELWVAGPKTALAVGDVVATPTGMAMANFEAKSVGRTFDTIWFVEWLRNGAPEPVCGGAAPLPEGHPAPTGAPTAPETFVGTVLETLPAGGYTYARLEVCGAERWIAGPPIALQVGRFAAVRGSVVMTDFASPTLNRTFDRLELVSSIEVVPAAPPCP